MNPNRAGSRCAAKNNLTSNRKVALANTKKIIIGLFGTAEMSEEEFKYTRLDISLTKNLKAGGRTRARIR